MTSVNTNMGAMTALMSLNSTSSALQATEKKISTGYKVADATDDGAAFAVAQNVRSNVNVLTAVNNQLGNTQGLQDVTNSAMKSATTLMTKMASDLGNLADTTTTSQQNAYQTTFAKDIQQLSSYLNGASYNGVSLIDKSSVALTPKADGTTTIAYTPPASGNSPTALSVVQDESGTQYSVSAFAQQTGTALATTAATTTTAAPTKFASANDLINQLVNIASGGSAAAKDALGAGTAGSAAAAGAGYATLSILSTQLNAQANTFAADTNFISNQVTFNSSKMDSLNVGLGALVDADLAKESANLTALQIKQQLGQQSLSIANQAPSGLASLFR